MTSQKEKYPSIKAKTVHYCMKCRLKIMVGQTFHKTPYDTCTSCIKEVKQEKAYERYRLLQLRPNGARELSRAAQMIQGEINEGLHHKPFENLAPVGELILFTFIFRHHPTEEDGEEYILAENKQQALSILNDFYTEDGFSLRPDEVPVKKADYRHPLHFRYQGIIAVNDYIEQIPYPHFVGSTSPNMGLSSKILVGHGEGKQYVVASLTKDGLDE